MFGPPKRKVPHTPRRRSFSRNSSLSSRSRSPRGSSANNIHVLLRVRPHTDREQQYRDVVDVLDDNLIIFDPKEEQDPFYVHGRKQKYRDITKPIEKNIQFGFDKVYGPEASTAELYQQSIKSLIQSLINGYNCSVFAYGATGSGKTFTMLGCHDNPGITPLLMQELYDTLEALENTKTEVVVSYLEIYNESVHDLLSEKRRVLQLREDGLTVHVPDLSWHCPQDAAKLMNMLHRGNQKRTQHPTDANAESSRSHAVFQVLIKMKGQSSSPHTSVVRGAKLAMIDLAGSERAAATKNSAERFIEGANINKSLLALGNCINALADGLHHVPFRNSKLTRLLKGSLGGNCRTVMIANVAPCSVNYEDTYNTLKYATRAKKIKTRVRKNQLSVGLTPAEFEEAIRQKQVMVEELHAKLAQQALEIGQLQAAISQAGLVVPMPTVTSEGEQVMRELYLHLERLLKAKTKLAMATDTLTTLQASMDKLQARGLDKKAKLLRARSLFGDDVKYETEEMVDERNAAPRRNLEMQMEEAEREVQTRREAEQQVVQHLHTWAKSRGAHVLDLTSTMHQLMSYDAQPDHVKCNVELECCKSLLKMKTLDQESFQKAFCLLAEFNLNSYFLLKGHNVCSPDIERNFEKLRSIVRNQYSVSWRDQHESTASSEAEVVSSDEQHPQLHDAGDHVLPA